MLTFRRKLVTASAATLALAFAGAATATTGGDHANNLGHRTFATCPSRDRHILRSTTAGASATLVPAGVRQLLLCRYSGLGSAPEPVGSASFRLLARGLVTNHATVRSLARKLNALKPAIGVTACPNDDGTAIIAFFRYGSTPKADDPVRVDLSGCSSVTNGHLQRTADTVSGLKLLRQLKRLTPSASTVA
ncbi:MAG: hypothetical protein M3065_23060 [Actinomycetota bacterium]|nr:hypothetical protein [Actinomycetota bacterium]